MTDEPLSDTEPEIHVEPLTWLDKALAILATLVVVALLFLMMLWVFSTEGGAA